MGRGAAGLRASAALPDGVVRGPRGPILRDDFVLSCLLELVVHSDDLADSLPALTPPPVLPEARDAVAAALAAEYLRRTGSPPLIGEVESWIREATGRAETADPAFPLL